ncbi:MAG: hypothetical protein ACJ71T_10420 [Actinomycetales bacterium]
MTTTSQRGRLGPLARAALIIGGTILALNVAFIVLMYATGQ